MLPDVHVCVPVLRRYDLLRGLLLSLQRSPYQPAAVHIIDNGRRPEKLAWAIANTVEAPVYTVQPDEPLGVAASWNWFIRHVEAERVISNDDITFGPDALQRLVETPGDLVFGYGFSCFLIRDSCVEKVGLFDEAISPGYAYWEDIDYTTRLEQVVPTPVCVNAPECHIDHGGSRTNAVASAAQIEEHHRRYLLARSNYIEKWKDLPPWMLHPGL